jgi:alkylation response protein AidB-like acyl-CoA dehydrogenase
MNLDTAMGKISEVIDIFSRNPDERQRRRSLDISDFNLLQEAGFHLIAVPERYGGLWKSPGETTRPMCELLRGLARVDSSLALVCSMHTTVLSFWAARDKVPHEYQAAWNTQRDFVFRETVAGAWWGTLTSEPGTNGDLLRSKAVAHRSRNGSTFNIHGMKHFGSGCGVTTYMITTAIPEGEARPDWFIARMPAPSWDGTNGIRLVSSWDGHGMTATQSHSVELCGLEGQRIAWPGEIGTVNRGPRGAAACTFTSVIVGILDAAMGAARAKLAGERATLSSYARVEWVNAYREAWLVVQAYEGMLRHMETDDNSYFNALVGKLAVSHLAESLTDRLSRLLGGSVYSRSSPFGYWQQDVRALGYLRPPWGLAYDQVFDMSWLE